MPLHAGSSAWSLNSNTTSSGSDGSNSSKSGGGDGAGGAVRPPDGEVTIVFTDITRAASLWEFNPNAMRDATLQHNELLRSLLAQHRGYEVIFAKDRNTGEGSFCIAFHTPSDALEWCMAVQQGLLHVDWPADLLNHPGAAEEWCISTAQHTTRHAQ
jgi:class 3 adenylate cyclase